MGINDFSANEVISEMNEENLIKDEIISFKISSSSILHGKPSLVLFMFIKKT